MTDSNTRPPIPPPPPSIHSQRRASGGPRSAASEQVTLKGDSGEISGWTVNQSRGGARLIVEDAVEVGQAWEMVETESGRRRPIRVVWVHAGGGGQVVGVQFLDAEGTIPPSEGTPSGTT